MMNCKKKKKTHRPPKNTQPALHSAHVDAQTQTEQPCLIKSAATVAAALLLTRQTLALCFQWLRGLSQSFLLHN